MNSPVSITFTFTHEEYILAIRRHYRSALQPGRDVVAGSLAIAGGAYLLQTSADGWISWGLVIPGSALLLMVAYTMFLLPMLIYRSQPRLKDEYSLTFTDEGIGFKTRNIDSTLQWTLYQSWRSDDDFYIMYYGNRDLTVIPRRVLADGDDERLREILTKNIGPPRD